MQYGSIEMKRCILVLFLAVCAAGPAEDMACNGHPELCGRRFDAVVFPTTHNAMSSQEAGYFFPNQGGRMRRQLDDGVRGLMLDLHKSDGKLLFCHSICALGSQDLVEGLVEIRAFLDENPNEVLAFLMEPSGVSAEEIGGAFDASGMTRYCLPHAVGAPWPTLQEMIQSNQRVVVLTDQKTGGFPWLLPMWTLMWDNDWSNHRESDFDCECNRGKATNDLFNLNQFISNPLPFAGGAEVANRGEALYRRAKECWDKTGRVPNFVTVDHYEVGELFEAVDRLNGVSKAGKK